MTATAVLNPVSFMHPHHGVASLDGPPFDRAVGGHTLAMQALIAEPAPAWASLLGLTGGALTAAAAVRSMIPVVALEEGSTPWAPCPEVVLAVVISRVRLSPVDLWVSRVDVPHPMKMVAHCSKRLGNLGDEENADYALAELVVQIADYLSLWHLATLNNNDHSAARKAAALAFQEALESKGAYWSQSIAQTYAMRANGRELIGNLARVASVIAAGTGIPPSEAASALDDALSYRLRANHDLLLGMALSARSDATNTA